MTSTEPGKGGIPAEAAGDGVQVNFVVLVIEPPGLGIVFASV